MDFADKLKAEKKRIGCSYPELCKILFNCEETTLKQWVLRKRIPDRVKCEALLFRLSKEPSKNKIVKSYKDLPKRP